MVEYRRIEHESHIIPYQKALFAAEVIAVDTETTGLDPHRDQTRLIQLAMADHPVLVIDCMTFLPAGRPMLKNLLTGKAVKVFQNGKFDIQFLRYLDIPVGLPVFDTMLAGQLLRQSDGPERVGLDSLVRYYLKQDLDKKEQRSDWRGILTEKQMQYAAQDAAVLIPLRMAMIPLLKMHGLSEVARLEFSCARALAQVEYTGIRLDGFCWADLREKTEKEKTRALEKIYEYVGRPVLQQSLFGDDISIGLNPDSNQQVMAWLKEQGILVDNTSRHTLSQHVSHPLVAAIMQYRLAAKAISSFLSTYPEMIHPVTGRLHPQYSQIGAWSGRMSCGKPNIQQIPRDPSFRSCFSASSGRLLVMADYSQIELRVAAEISQDQRMIQAYAAGEDLHRLTASLITGVSLDKVTSSERQAAKAVNFGLIYGMGAKGLQDYARDTYGIEMTGGEASLFRNRFFDAYAGIAQWHQSFRASTPKEARTLSGRRHLFSENAGLSIYTNIPVQGGAADILKQALGILMDELQCLDAQVIAVVHDEIIVETAAEDAKETAQILKQAMESAGAHYLKKVPVFVDVKIGADWAEK